MAVAAISRDNNLRQAMSVSDSALDRIFTHRDYQYWSGSGTRGRGRRRGTNRGRGRGRGSFYQRGNWNSQSFSTLSESTSTIGHLYRHNRRKRKRNELDNESSMYLNRNSSNFRHTHARLTATSHLQFKCYNCGETGHIARKCPYAAVEICFKCGLDHSGYECSNEVCLRCLSGDHWTQDCLLSTMDAKEANQICVNCGAIGDHIIDDCPMMKGNRTTIHMMDAEMKSDNQGVSNIINDAGNDQTDMNIVSLRYVNEFDHSSRVSASSSVMCSNCTANGNHSSYHCKKRRMPKGLIARGMSVSKRDPRLCSECLTPFHRSHECPLLLLPYQSSVS